MFSCISLDFSHLPNLCPACLVSHLMASKDSQASTVHKIDLYLLCNLAFESVAFTEVLQLDHKLCRMISVEPADLQLSAKVTFSINLRYD